MSTTEQPQNMIALANANEIRRIRTGIKRNATPESIAFVVRNPVPETENWPVEQIIRSVPHWGIQRTVRLLQHAGIRGRRTLGQISERQRERLAEGIEG